MDRKKITFEQAEGLAPLPSQLKPKVVSKELRALLWHMIYSSLEDDIIKPEYMEPFITGKWETILRTKHVMRDHGMTDEFTRNPDFHIKELKAVYSKGNYAEVLGLTEWFLRQKSCPPELKHTVHAALVRSRAAYRLIDGDTIVPIATEEEANALQQAFSDLRTSEFNGARTHLKNAATSLMSGKAADSVRESIHAVESVARVLAPKDKLSDALAELAARTNMHKGMRAAFGSLYGYASEEQGIRHPLLAEGDAKVDEADALFMIGACAAFVSYMIAKGRAAGIVGA